MMPRYDLRLIGSSLLIEVGVSSPKNYASASNPPATFLAVIDTGANASVVSPKVARAMKTPELGMQPVLLSGGKISFDPIYDIMLRVGGHITKGPWHPLLVTSTEPATPDVDVIIGMDLLIKLQWAWDGPSVTGWISG
jgi:predicted aspartyl protease